MNAQQLPDPSLPWPVPMPAVALIAEAEQGPQGGCALKSYRCPAGVWTLGWGETAGVYPEQTCTKAEADQWLSADLGGRTVAVLAMCGEAHPNPNQLGALVSLAYNIGLAAMPKSTVMKCHVAGDLSGAARAFGLWNKATVDGKLVELAGLTSRRAAEAALYLTPDPQSAPIPQMPQAVAPESNVATRPINVAGAATVAMGAVTAASSVAGPAADVVAKMHDIAAAFGIQPLTLMGLVLVGVGGVVIVQRVRQRAGGWA